ncbi:hypothetical protein KY290_019381 [Solanum tuberosum]|nr:hypothetical protein KY284_018385 [Solanum tuberosum]KAH0763308.1 hypothetical protein KY290_019381 [Solanum tuberosum]
MSRQTGQKLLITRRLLQSFRCQPVGRDLTFSLLYEYAYKSTANPFEQDSCKLGSVVLEGHGRSFSLPFKILRIKRKIASPLGRPRVLCKKDQGGSYPKGEGGGVGASFRGGIEAKKFVHATTIYMEGQFC